MNESENWVKINLFPVHDNTNTNKIIAKQYQTIL